MKALSLRQPWAAFVLFHGKRIENRKWSTSFRGEFFIHAAGSMTLEEHADAMAMLIDVNGPQPEGVCRVEDLKFGGIVGVANLVAVVPPRAGLSLLSVESHYPPGVNWRWHMPEQKGFVLENVRPTKFVPMRGMPSFFDVPEDLAREALGLGK
ncbi:MAG TPA: ASCH domain-containing protein [Polyangiaceae bacterium]|jgi:hypothetical protein